MTIARNGGAPGTSGARFDYFALMRAVEQSELTAMARLMILILGRDADPVPNSPGVGKSRLSVREIARRMGTDAKVVTRATDLSERKGWLTVDRPPEGARIRSHATNTYWIKPPSIPPPA